MIGDYVTTHSERGECGCGKCIDRGDRPDPPGHTEDVYFFKVALRNNPTPDEFEALTRQWSGLDPLDGKEHGYMELGAWLGDQGVALQYMGMGALLGVFDLLTPRKVFPDIPKEDQDRMAGMGLVTVTLRRGRAS